FLNGIFPNARDETVDHYHGLYDTGHSFKDFGVVCLLDVSASFDVRDDVGIKTWQQSNGRRRRWLPSFHPLEFIFEDEGITPQALEMHEYQWTFDLGEKTFYFGLAQAGPPTEILERRRRVS